MKRIIPLFLFIFALVACVQGENAMKGGYDSSGIINVLDPVGKQLLIEEETKTLLWISLPDNDRIDHYKVGQQVVVWIDGEIAESSPAQAKALHIERSAPKEKSIGDIRPTFDFENKSFPPFVNGFVQIGEQRIEMAKGGFRWVDKNRSVTTDAAGPELLAARFEPIVLSPGTTIDLLIDQKPHLHVKLWGKTTEDVAIQGNQLTLPIEEGRYIYEALASWTNGETSFTFVIEIK